MTKLTTLTVALLALGLLSACASNLSNEYDPNATSAASTTTLSSIATSTAAINCQQLLITNGTVASGEAIELYNTSNQAYPVTSTTTPTSYVMMTLATFQTDCGLVGITIN